MFGNLGNKHKEAVESGIVCPPVSCFSFHDTNDPLSLPYRALRSAIGAKERDVKAIRSLNSKDGIGAYWGLLCQLLGSC